MIWIVALALIAHSIAMIGLGGWLHYHFGDTVRRIEEIVKHV